MVGLAAARITCPAAHDLAARCAARRAEPWRVRMPASRCSDCGRRRCGRRRGAARRPRGQQRRQPQRRRAAHRWDGRLALPTSSPSGCCSGNSTRADRGSAPSAVARPRLPVPRTPFGDPAGAHDSAITSTWRSPMRLRSAQRHDATDAAGQGTHGRRVADLLRRRDPRRRPCGERSGREHLDPSHAKAWIRRPQGPPGLVPRRYEATSIAPKSAAAQAANTRIGRACS